MSLLFSVSASLSQLLYHFTNNMKHVLCDMSRPWATSPRLIRIHTKPQTSSSRWLSHSSTLDTPACKNRRDSSTYPALTRSLVPEPVSMLLVNSTNGPTSTHGRMPLTSATLPCSLVTRQKRHFSSIFTPTRHMVNCSIFTWVATVKVDHLGWMQVSSLYKKSLSMALRSRMMLLCWSISVALLAMTLESSAASSPMPQVVSSSRIFP